jgi:NTP pyrophosphatase (non-canonical NTP hydrolase)
MDHQEDLATVVEALRAEKALLMTALRDALKAMRMWGIPSNAGSEMGEVGMSYDRAKSLLDALDASVTNAPKVQVRRTILGWQRHVYGVAKSRGWHSGEPDIWKFLGNLMAEVAEAWEEAREPYFEPTRTYYREDGKPEGLPTELADVVIRAMDTAESFGIDLEAAIAEKSAFNETRPMRHGGKRA